MALNRPLHAFECGFDPRQVGFGEPVVGKPNVVVPGDGDAEDTLSGHPVDGEGDHAGDREHPADDDQDRIEAANRNAEGIEHRYQPSRCGCVRADRRNRTGETVEIDQYADEN